MKEKAVNSSIVVALHFVCVGTVLHVLFIDVEGAIGVALGSACSGAFTNSDKFWNKMQTVKITACNTRIF